MAAVGVEITPGAAIETGLGIAVIGEFLQFLRSSRQFAVEHADVFQRCQLIGDHTPVVVVLVHLGCDYAKCVFARNRVAHIAFSAAREVPVLLAFACRSLDRKLAINALGIGEFGFGLGIIPNIGVAIPD